MAVGQILYIPTVHSWTAICSSLRCSWGLRPVLLKEVQDWPKHVDGHPLPCVVEIRSCRITFTPDGLRWQGMFGQKAELLRALGSVEICLDATRLSRTSVSPCFARGKGQIKRQQVIKELNHPFAPFIFFFLFFFFPAISSRSI